jgi:hypothetical protein
MVSGLNYTIGENTYNIGSELPVYNKDQVDAKFKGLNGLTYKGTVGSKGSIGSLPTSEVSIGDMYLVASEEPINGGKNGDLFIATSDSDEGDNGYIVEGKIKWTLVPSGDDIATDTTYTLNYKTEDEKRVFELKDINNQAQGSFSVKAGESIAIDGGADMVIKHVNVTRSDDEVEAFNGSDLTLISGIESNA